MYLPTKTNGVYELVPQQQTETKPKEAKTMSGQVCRNVLAKAILQIVCLLGLLFPMAYVYVISNNYEPYHRGFFCDDQNLKHPYTEQQTVPMSICIIIWAVICVFFIILIESLRTYVEKDKANPIDNSKYTPLIAIELYRHFGYFLLGAISCLLFTEVAKYTIGRLRPHFLTICKPDYSTDLCREQPDSGMGFQRYVTESEEQLCSGGLKNGTTKKMLKEARLSFLSGHSSFSFYCATFMVVYLQSRLSRFPKNKLLKIQCVVRCLKIARPFIQFILIILAFWISLTRISDYFHHPMDVLTGSLVGMLFAAATLIIIADTFNRPWTFRVKHDVRLKHEDELVLVEQQMQANSAGIRSGPNSNIPLASAEDLPYADESESRNTQQRFNKNTKI